MRAKGARVERRVHPRVVLVRLDEVKTVVHAAVIEQNPQVEITARALGAAAAVVRQPELAVLVPSREEPLAGGAVAEEIVDDDEAITELGRDTLVQLVKDFPRDVVAFGSPQVAQQIIVPAAALAVHLREVEPGQMLPIRL